MVRAPGTRRATLSAMPCSWEKVRLGPEGPLVTPLGLGSSYGLPGAEVERAFERGLNYFYWGSWRRDDFGAGLRRLARRHRDEMVVTVQSYTRVASWMRVSLERALRRLGLDHADVLLLGLWNRTPPRRIRAAARALRDAGLCRHLALSCHNRPAFEDHIAEPTWDSIMVRYNAAHPGAELDVFPHLGRRRRPGVIAYTATSWGHLLDPRRMPPGEATPRASDCYRFALTNPNVDLVLSGPKDAAQLDEAMAALDRGPMTPDELEWMKRVGAATG